MSTFDEDRVLVVGPAWIGDMVMCQSLFKVVRERRPDARIDVLAPESTRPLLARMPEVTEALPLRVGHGQLRPLEQWRVARDLRRRRYQWAIVTRRSFKSALPPFLARIPRRTGILGEARRFLLNDVRHIDSRSHPAAVERLAALGLDAGARPGMDGLPWPRLRVDSSRGAGLEAELALEGAGPVVGLAPGAAYGPAKRWPLEKWTTLAERIAALGMRIWVFGSDAERELGERVARAGGTRARNLSSRTRLEDVVDLMARCRSVVTNDSGLMHIAAAVGCRVVAVFGSTSPENTPPLARDAHVLWLAPECSPCFQRRCPLGHLRCLRELAVEAVMEAVTALPLPS